MATKPAHAVPAPLGAPIWVDLTTSDLPGAQRFYGAVFGWSFDVGGPETGGYVTASVEGKPVAGLMANQPEWEAPDGWTTYLHTADADATVAAVTAAGGSACGAVFDVPGHGRMVALADPTGGRFALWQPRGHDGIAVAGVAGAPVYHQLSTRDFATVVDFYVGVFGWQLQVESDTDEFRYSNAIFEGQPLLGVMDGVHFLPADAPSEWTFFLGAEDVDATLRALVEHGGTVVRGAEDTPYGRLAAVTDPTGASLHLASVPTRQP